MCWAEGSFNKELGHQIYYSFFFKSLMASSSSTILPKIRYDVYVSYRVEDTGNKFTSHLKSALDRNGIKALIDDGLDKGEEISKTLLNVISESQISVVILSENYAGSQRCLDELVKIMACKKENGATHHVLPVFIGVEPTHVRKQINAAFETLSIQNQQWKDNENTWRRALVEIADISGWDPKNTSEAETVSDIVECIKEIVNKQSLNSSHHDFVGISRVEKVESLLRLESIEDVQSIGIWGTGSIGKTTIAEIVFSRISNQFDGACFLRNVRDSLERQGLDYLSKDMLSQLFNSRNLQAPLNFSSPAVHRAFKRSKFLVVLDDLTNSPQLKSLVKPHNFYGPGTRIILTSRDKQVLKNYECKKEHIYEVKELNHSEALRLFAFHAFKQQPCTKRHKELSEKALSYAKGLPLALIVLGCNLYDKDIKEWESGLEKLEDSPDGTIKDILMISYAGLEKTEKSIFLDIACIFLDWIKNQVETILNACRFYATRGISRLRDKALIFISNGRLGMHDLLQQIGQDIVFQECIEEPGRRSRLWRFMDFYDAMTRNKVTEKVEVISVDLSKATDMKVMPETFEKMSQLRVLNSYNSYGIKIRLPNGLGFLSDKLRYLQWDGFPLTSFHDKLNMINLVELIMMGSSIKQLWSEGVDDHVPNLKVMDLSFSWDLISLPDFSKCPNLERLKLRDCSSLTEIPSSIQHLSKLRYLNLEGCSKFTKLPVLPSNVVHLVLSRTAMKELPSWIGCLSQLHNLDVSFCPKLDNLPNSIGELKCLQVLDVSGCRSLTSLPESLGNIQSLYCLTIRWSGVTALPSSLCPPGKLKKLDCLMYTHNLFSLLPTYPFVGNWKSLPEIIEHHQYLPLHLKICNELQSSPDLPPGLLINTRKCTTPQILCILFGGDPTERIEAIEESSFKEYDGNETYDGGDSDEGEEDKISLLNSWKYHDEDGDFFWNDWGTRSFLSVPKDKAPKWFVYREDGSGVKLELFGQKSKDLSQLAFYCVVSFANDLPPFKASCKCLLVTNKFGPLQVQTCCNGAYKVDIRVQSEHVVVWFADIRQLLWYEGGIQQLHTPLMCSEATFEFNAEPVSIDCKIVRCGATPIARNCESRRLPPVEDVSQGHQEEEEGLSHKRLKYG